jgi:predicted permease
MIAALSLALGIGANITVFSLANGLLLKPLPVGEPESVVSLYSTSQEGTRTSRFSYPDYQDLKSSNQAFADLVAYTVTPVSLGAGDAVEPVLAEVVSGNYFSALRVGAVPGRIFSDDEDNPARGRVAVLGYHFWQRRFGSSPDVIGKPISLNGEQFTVIGVAEKSYTGIALGPFTDVYVPLMHSGRWIGPDWSVNRGRPVLRVAGRLKDGVEIDRAQAEAQTLAGRLAEVYPETNRGKSIELVEASLLEGRRRNSVAAFFVVLLAAVAAVLVIACGNIANLMLVRAVGRQREIAIRQAIGATRLRLIQQFVTESLMLAIVGGGAGLLISLWAGGLLTGFNPLPDFQIQVDMSADARVLGFTLLSSVLAGLALGLIPAMTGSKIDLVPALKDAVGARNSLSSKTRARNLLVVAQIALSLVLVIGAGLLLRSLYNAETGDPGFAVENSFAMDFDLDLKGLDEEQGIHHYRTMIERVGSLPGVDSVTLANRAPMDISTPTVNVAVEGHDPPTGSKGFTISFYRVGTRYFETMSIPLLRGHDFSDRDNTSSPGVVIINETMAARFWPGEDPLGKHLRLVGENIDGMAARPLEVIGVARDSKYRTMSEDPTPLIYLPFEQDYDPSMTLLVRVLADSSRMMSVVRGELLAIDKDPQAFFARTMQNHLGVALAPGRIAAALFAIFGGLALLLAVVGLYGVVSYSVSQQTREIGIRLALGADRHDIVRLVVGRGLLLTGTGVAAGLALAFVATGVLSSLLFGVGSHDPATFAGVSILFAAVALVASYIPARRASRVDPVVALRHD